MTKHTVYLGLGANLGDRAATLRRAVSLLDSRVGTVLRQSSFLETQPWGYASDHRFLNACVCCATTLTPHEVLDVTRRIEIELGRTQKSAGGIYHDRMIDIDLLLYDDRQVDEPDLKIPHPLMRERDFVMIPLREICPDLS